MAKRIVFTGGGSAGHVTPNMALFPQLLSEGYEIHYIGTADGIEKKLMADKDFITYHEISAGKLRRYFSLKTLETPFKVLKGVAESRAIIKELKPDVVFSKGGYVSVPVVVAASECKVPVVTHESDYTPGLANKINSRYTDKICVTFEDTLKFTGKKGIHTGTPIRPELYKGTKEKGLEFLGFTGEKPVLMIMGGSLGAAAINQAVREALDKLERTFDIVHLCGAGKVEEGLNSPSYKQYEFISAELSDVFAATDIVISRAGANAVFELLALCKPMLLIPLPLSASRGDQIQNAGYFSRKGYAMVLEQERLNAKSLLDSVNDLYDRRLSFIATMSAEAKADGTDEVLDVIRAAAEEGRKK